MTQSVVALLRSHGLSPKKSLGQNFLVDPIALERIVAAAELSPHDTVVEVGAGLGNLTQLLAGRVEQVVAVELDGRLIEILRTQVADYSNVQIVHGDILKIADLGVGSNAYKVVANLPYYVTSAVLRRFLENQPRPSLMVVTVQQEVAERMVAEPGDMSLLAVSVQFYGQPQIVARIRAGAFYPSPNVESAVVRIEVDDAASVTLRPGVAEKDFFRVVKAGFGQKRKMLRNSLGAGLALSPSVVEESLARVGIDARRRAQTLHLVEWARIVDALVPLYK